jgi:hypothetical protein
MRIKWTLAMLIPMNVIAISCATVTEYPTEIVLDQSTQQVEGWFDYKGELALFPIRNVDDYDPFAKQENLHCVSLVNRTGSATSSSNFARLDGSRVIATGFAIKYADLAYGTSDTDRLLAKRYYEDQRVENFCYRPFVFVATSLRRR